LTEQSFPKPGKTKLYRSKNINTLIKFLQAKTLALNQGIEKIKPILFI